MEQGGARPIALGESHLRRGDVAVFPFQNTNVFGPPPATLNAIGVVCVPLTNWVSTMSSSLGAGFYSDVYGQLPFAMGNVRRDCYGLMEIGTGLSITPEGAWIPREE